jgi:hypothetical protein
MKARNTRTRWLYPFAVALMISFATSVVGAGDVMANEFAEKALRPGSWSLQFGVLGDFQERSFGGLVMSCKRHYSERSAIRLGLDVSTKSTDAENTEDSYSSCTTRSDDGDGSSMVAVTAQYLFYPSSHKTTNVFFGIGPNLGYSRNKSEDDYLRYCDETTRIERRWIYSYSIRSGLRGSVGFEWFLAENVGLLAEYSVRCVFNYTESESQWGRMSGSPQSTRSLRVMRGFELASESVRVGFSVYL